MTCTNTRALLDIATAMLAMQREITALRQQVEALSNPKPSRWNIQAVTVTLIQLIGRFLLTQYGQSLIAVVIAGVAGCLKWLGIIP